MSKRLNMRKTLIIMVVLNILQTFGILAVTLYRLLYEKQQVTYGQLYLLSLLLLMSLAGTLVSFSLVRPVLIIRLKLKQQEDSLVEINNLNMTLRAQRHDFMNQLQVVYGLIEIGEFTEAKSYIEKEYEGVEKLSSILKTKIPAVNAILQAKCQMCEKRGIDVHIDIRSTLFELPIPDWEYCKVLGNLIDNSINALQEKEGEKRLTIELFEDLQFFRFRISNNGPVINPKIREKIFEAGFTTRVGSGEGMGLAICRRIINRYDGSITVSSDKEKTSFEGSIPRMLMTKKVNPNTQNDSWVF